MTILTDPQLRSQVDALWDRFWSGGISKPLNAIQQMSYLIFLKRLEDQDNAKIKAAKRRSTKYKSIFDRRVKRLKNAHKCKWSYWSQLPGEEMLPFVRKKQA